MFKAFDATKRAAYLLWEYTGYEDAMSHIYCAEDIACYLESASLLSLETLDSILARGPQSKEYIDFVRGVSYRIFYYTHNYVEKDNWRCAEALINNREWLSLLADVASCYREMKSDPELLSHLHSDKARSYYSAFSSGGSQV